MATEAFWENFWDEKANEATDFQATGRGRMDIVGFLYTVRECAMLLGLRPTDRLIDVGCGTGIFALALSPFVKSIEAFDISGTAVDRARKNLSDAPNVSAGVGSITSLPCGNGQFEKALAYSVLQYLAGEDAVAAAFRELARVLAPGGMAVLAGNPDPARRKLVEDEIRANNDEAFAQKSIDLLAKTLWLSAEKLVELAQSAGLAARPVAISPRIQQHTYMFDLVVTKSA